MAQNVKTYYQNGQLREICNYVNGNFEGEYKIYDKNGQVKEIYNITNGIRKNKN